MTALERYIRLEALGQWRESPGAAPREVVVSFKNATLVLTDMAEAPLGHWALAGVQAIGRDGPAVVYSMTADGAETLTIRDDDMIEAISAVSRADALARQDETAEAPRRGRLWLLLGIAVCLAGAITAAPQVIRMQAARITPPERIAEFGDRMLLQIMAVRGPLCADPAGGRALDALAARVAEDAPPRMRALDLGPAPVALLPGPTVLIGRAALETATDPAEIAGWIALALAREAEMSGAERLMTAIGPMAGLRYLATGRIEDGPLARAAKPALAPPAAEEITAAFAALKAAGLPTAPFAAGLARAGIAAPPGDPDGAEALTPEAWAALRRLCG
jgi:hypothetical protein